MDNIIIRKIKLPNGLFGLSIKDPAGDYNVYLADWLPPDLERATLEHELAHIDNGHLESELPVEVLEQRAREIARW